MADDMTVGEFAQRAEAGPLSFLDLAQEVSDGNTVSATFVAGLEDDMEDVLLACNLYRHLGDDYEERVCMAHAMFHIPKEVLEKYGEVHVSVLEGSE